MGQAQDDRRSRERGVGIALSGKGQAGLSAPALALVASVLP